MNNQKKSAQAASRWYRDESGTYEEKINGGKAYSVRIASHGIEVTELLYVVSDRGEKVHYILTVSNHSGNAIRIELSHDDLLDVASFLRRMPPGFSLASCPRAFATVRECLMEDVPKAKRAAILTCLGWYYWQGSPIFAHAGGIICSGDCFPNNGALNHIGTPQVVGIKDIDATCSDVPILGKTSVPISRIQVRVPEQFAMYQLSQAPSVEELRGDIDAVFDLLLAGDPSVTYPALGALFFSSIKDPSFAVFMHGSTGVMKSAFAKLLLSFHVPNPRDHHFASFKSTENALRARFSSSGNSPVVLDDYVQMPGARNGGPEAQKAENLIRSIVNGAAKDRCGGTGGMRPSDRPRGLAFITGEQLPDGLDSLRNRMVCLPVDKATFSRALEGPRPNRFDNLQELASRGSFAHVMYSYLAWGAGRFNDLYSYAEEGVYFDAGVAVPNRIKDSSNNVLTGIDMFLQFALDHDACSPEEAEEHWAKAQDAYEELLQRERLESLNNSPTEAFADLLRTALVSHRVHLEVENIRDHAENPNLVPLDLLGYSAHTVYDQVDGNADEGQASQEYVESRTVYRPNGMRVGWIDKDIIDLVPDAAMQVANSIAKGIGISPLPSRRILAKKLVNDRFLNELSKNKNVLNVRKAGHAVMGVWRTHARTLFEMALDWSEFDVAAYIEMTELEQQMAWEDKRSEYASHLNERLCKYGFGTLVNPHLTEEDRRNLLLPDPPVSGLEIARQKKLIPSVSPKHEAPSPLPIPGYSDPPEDGLLA